MATPEHSTKGRAYLYEQLASAQDEASVRVTDARGELAKGARVAGVRVCAKQHLPCTFHMSAWRRCVLWGQAGQQHPRQLTGSPGMQCPSCAMAMWQTPL